MLPQKPNAAQIRAAISLLGWENEDLAKDCGVTAQSISNIKRGATRPQPRVLAAIKRVLEFNGIEFLENSGVRFRSGDLAEYKGIDGFKRFMDDVYTAACDSSAADGSKPICISNVDDRLFIKHLGDYMSLHVQRMNDLKNVKVHILAREQDFYAIPTGHYITYKCSSKQVDGTVPFYVYGDKLAILMLDESQDIQITVISSPLAAKAFRGQFEILWHAAKPTPRKKSA